VPNRIQVKLAARAWDAEPHGLVALKGNLSRIIHEKFLKKERISAKML
jgi:hypothetical protein